MSRPRILLLDDNAAFAASLSRGLRTAFDIRCVTSIAEAQAALDSATEFVLADIVLDEEFPRERTGLKFVAWAVRERPDVPVVVLTGHGEDQLEVEALRLGAADYIEKGTLNLELLRAKVEALLENRRDRVQNREMKSRLEVYEPSALIGESDTIHALRDLIQQLAGSDATVFITGESGTGKEVVARALHRASPRREKPFLAVNCAALSAGLLESELFGHEKGSFTNAYERRIGAFEKAHGGALLLDEVTEIDIGLQAKLLRALQEKQIQRVGNNEPVTVDVRIVATTNRLPEEAVRSGNLRQDLFYRLNVMRVEVPPLRQHPEDVPLLVKHFIEKHQRRTATRVVDFAPAAFGLLQRYFWPGNVRELENIVERACTLCRDREVPPNLLAPWLETPASVSGVSLADDNLNIEYRSALARLQALSIALERTHGNKQEAQKLLGFTDRSTMRRTVARLCKNHPELSRCFPLVAASYGNKSPQKRAKRHK